jgi:hypothetical protein
MVPGDHGSPITEYSIEVDDGVGGDFRVASQTMSMSVVIIEDIISGTHYRFRYRAKNEIGFGLYSEIAYILTASAPTDPTLITIRTELDTVVIEW